MKKQLMTVLASAMLLGGLLTACSSKESKPVDNTPAKTESAEAGNTAKGDVPLKMVYWHPEQKDIMEEINAKFMQENPGIKVELELVPADQYDKVLKTRFLSNDGPDVFLYFGGTAYLYGKDGYFGDITNESFAANVLPAFKGSVSYENKMYAVPLNVSASAVLYSKKAFQQAGIASAPKTYAEFLADCQKLKDAGLIPIARGAKDAWTGLIELAPLIANEVLNKNPDFQLDRFNGKFTFATNADVKNLFTKYAELVDKGYIDKGVLGMNHSQAAQQVADGKAGMMMGISVFYGDIIAANKDADIGYFPLPDENGKFAMMGASDKAIGYWKDSKHAAEAKKLVAFYARPDIDQMYCEATQMLPTIKDVNVDLPEPLKMIAKDLASTSTLYTWFDAPWPLPASDQFRKEIQNIHTGEKDIDQMLKNMDKAYDDNKSAVTAPTVK